MRYWYHSSRVSLKRLTDARILRNENISISVHLICRHWRDGQVHKTSSMSYPTIRVENMTVNRNNVIGWEKLKLFLDKLSRRRLVKHSVKKKSILTLQLSQRTENTEIGLEYTVRPNVYLIKKGKKRTRCTNVDFLLSFDMSDEFQWSKRVFGKD